MLIIFIGKKKNQDFIITLSLCFLPPLSPCNIQGCRVAAKCVLGDIMAKQHWEAMLAAVCVQTPIQPHTQIPLTL